MRSLCIVRLQCVLHKPNISNAFGATARHVSLSHRGIEDVKLQTARPNYTNRTLHTDPHNTHTHTYVKADLVRVRARRQRT